MQASRELLGIFGVVYYLVTLRTHESVHVNSRPFDFFLFNSFTKLKDTCKEIRKPLWGIFGVVYYLVASRMHESVHVNSRGFLVLCIIW